MCVGTADQIDQRGHAEQAAADTEEAGQHAGEEAHENREPRGTVDPRHLEMHHGRNLDLVQRLVPGEPYRAVLVHDTGFLLLDRLSVIHEDHEGYKDEHAHIHPANNRSYSADALQPHDDLSAAFDSDDRADDHGEAQLVVHVSEFRMPEGGDHGLSGDVGDVSADGKGHRKAQDVQPRGDHPRASHSEEAADNANRKTYEQQARPEDVESGDGHVHI